MVCVLFRKEEVRVRPLMLLEVAMLGCGLCSVIMQQECEPGFECCKQEVQLTGLHRISVKDSGIFAVSFFLDAWVTLTPRCLTVTRTKIVVGQYKPCLGRRTRTTPLGTRYHGPAYELVQPMVT